MIIRHGIIKINFFSNDTMKSRIFKKKQIPATDKDWRRYKESKTEISTDGTTWTALHDASVDGAYKESPLGRKYGPNSGSSAKDRYTEYLSNERTDGIWCDDLYVWFRYNGNDERRFMQFVDSRAVLREIFYLGSNYEQEQIEDNTIERIYLGGTPYNAPAVAIRTNEGAWQIHYIHRDYLGSYVAVSDASGNAVEKRSYTIPNDWFTW